MNTPTMSSGSNSPEAKRTFAAAARLSVVFIVASLAVLGVALVWVSGCRSGGGEEVLAHCGAVRRNFLAAGPGVVLFVGGVWAFARAIQVWRAEGRWWIWQGAGWFLLTLMLLMVTMTAPFALL